MGGVFQRLRIGGDPGEHREKLMEMIEDYGFNQMDSDAFCLECDVEEAHEGCEGLAELKAYMRSIGLSYDHYVEENSGEGSYIWYWRPGFSPDGETEGFVLATNSHTPVIDTESLRAWMAEGMTLEKILETYDLPELPVWVTEDDAALDISTGKCVEKAQLVITDHYKGD